MKATLHGPRIALLLLTITASSACEAQPARPTRVAPQDKTCTVTRIIDGDTFECGTAGRVRLIGVDAPELNQRPYGNQSRDALVSIMPVGTEIRLEFDVSPADRYKRALGYAWIDSTMINESMVQMGWALSERYPPNVRQQQRLNTAQQNARDKKSGLWASGGFDCKPADRRRRTC